ncbi:unnamed protein product [Linum tenue]|uniref:Uncharacterized protein n=3 Tax=Linum tenue TaxID=586396 RepID=A0AAV0JIR6_9ROSI|nr:unnamed protein product [Linum tenue]
MPKSNKIRHIVRIQQMLKQWRRKARANASSASSSSNSSPSRAAAATSLPGTWPSASGRAAGDSPSGRLTSTIRSSSASWRMPRRSSVSPTPARCGSPARRWSSRRF